MIQKISIFILFPLITPAVSAQAGSMGRGLPIAKDEDGIYKFKLLNPATNKFYYNSGNEWYVAPAITFPTVKLRQSPSEDTMYETTLITGLGGGISFNQMYIDHGEKEVADMLKSNVSINLYVIVNSIEKADKTTELSTALGASVGILDNRVMLGLGYELGKIEPVNGKEVNRLFFSIGFGTYFLKPAIAKSESAEQSMNDSQK
ncbi:MAG: hypothetical protein OEZ32_03490 [Nitrospinota bacterium]|nr:hypothetical protein [Nitrospinota bacterium]